MVVTLIITWYLLNYYMLNINYVPTTTKFFLFYYSNFLQ